MMIAVNVPDAGKQSMSASTETSLAEPLVSVVIPTYNAEPYIGATLRSVLAQTFQRFEIIVVDDRSRDKTADVVEAAARVEPRIRLIRLEKNFGGPAGPRNVGVQQARGQWVAFLDADDIWHPDKLRVQLELVARTGHKFCSSKMLDFHDERELIFAPVVATRTSEVSFLAQLIKFRTPTSSVLVETEVIRKHHFNPDPRYKAREDLDCWLHCLEEIGTSIKIEHPLIGYRVSPQQISGNKMTMVKRHHHVLRNYTFRSGRKLGLGAALFTLTHFAIASYTRLVLKEL